MITEDHGCPIIGRMKAREIADKPTYKGDWTFTPIDLITFASFVAAIVLTYSVMRSEVNVLNYRLSLYEAEMLVVRNNTRQDQRDIQQQLREINSRLDTLVGAYGATKGPNLK